MLTARLLPCGNSGAFGTHYFGKAVLTLEFVYAIIIRICELSQEYLILFSSFMGIIDKNLRFFSTFTLYFKRNYVYTKSRPLAAFFVVPEDKPVWSRRQ